jgi:hypothetical protein
VCSSDLTAEGNFTANGLANITGKNLKLDSNNINYQYDDFLISGLIDNSMQSNIGTKILNTSASAISIAYIGNDRIVYTTGIYSPLFIKSSLLNDTPVQLTTYNVTNVVWCGNNIIVFVKYPDGKLYKKSILNIDNETALTTSAQNAGGTNGSTLCYIGNNRIAFVALSDHKLYTKSILDTDNLTNISSYIVTGNLFYAGNNIIVFAKNDALLYIKSSLTMDGETNISSWQSETTVCFSYIGNGHFLCQKFNSGSGPLYRKSIFTVNSESLVHNNITSGSWYIGQGNILYRYSDNYIYMKSIKGFY